MTAAPMITKGCLVLPALCTIPESEALHSLGSCHGQIGGGGGGGSIVNLGARKVGVAMGGHKNPLHPLPIRSTSGPTPVCSSTHRVVQFSSEFHWSCVGSPVKRVCESQGLPMEFCRNSMQYLCHTHFQE